MEKSVVKNEFECQQKCIENESRCKSCNVYLEENNVICELNNKTRLMKAADFKKRRGSTYYGLVQVSSVVCMNSPLHEVEFSLFDYWKYIFFCLFACLF